MVKKSKMTKRILGKKRNLDEINDSDDETITVIQTLKENNNFLINDNVKYRIENKELKEKIQESSKILKSLRYYLYTALVIDAIALVGVAIDYYHRKK
jgi:hypothetical protein